MCIVLFFLSFVSLMEKINGNGNDRFASIAVPHTRVRKLLAILNYLLGIVLSINVICIY